jgi:curved DNA-binding protein CbpA
VTDPRFVDHYEILQLSPNASAEMIERVYRVLAKRYHPDNAETGDVDRFTEVQAAFEVLSSPVARAAYDVKHDDHRALTWKIFKQDGAGDSRAEDRRLFHGILSLLYIARRRDPHGGGLGGVSLEKMLGCPQEHLEFPLWYLKQRGWIERLGSGYFAITADGVDKLGNDDLSLPANRLLSESSSRGASETSSDAPSPQVLLEGDRVVR